MQFSVFQDVEMETFSSMWMFFSPKHYKNLYYAGFLKLYKNMCKKNKDNLRWVGMTSQPKHRPPLLQSSFKNAIIHTTHL